MKREEFYFDSRDGQSQIYAVRFTPEEGVKVRGVVQIIHGMCEHIGRYTELAEFLTSQGIVVTGDDHLGHGKTAEVTGKFGYFCRRDPATVVVRDVHRLKKKTEADFPGVPYIIMGHSMGSFILRNYLMRYGSGIKAAIIMGTGMQPRMVVKMAKAVAGIQTMFGLGTRKGKFIDKIAFGNYNARIDNPKTASDWLTGEDVGVEKFLADPLCGFTFTVNGFGTLFELIDRLYDTEALAKIPKELPLFMLAGDADPVGDYGVGVQKAYESLVNAGLTNIQKKMYPGARHELLHETARGEVMDDIYSWLQGIVDKE